MNISKTKFDAFADGMPVDTVQSKLVDATPGSRLYPSQTYHAEEVGNFRLEAGNVLPDGRKEVIFKANRNAKDKNVRDVANNKDIPFVVKVPVDLTKEAECIRKDAKATFKISKQPPAE